MDPIALQAQALIDRIERELETGRFGEARATAASLAGMRAELRSPARDPILGVLLSLAQVDLKAGPGPLRAAEALSEAQRLVDANENVVPLARAALAEMQGRAAKAEGRWDDARVAYRRAIDIVTPVLGEPGMDLQLGKVVGNLGDLEEQAGNLITAVELYDHSLTHVRDPIVQSALLSNMGRAFDAYGRYGEAVAAHQSALAIRQTIPDAEALVAESQSNLASALGDTVRYREAETAFKNAMAGWGQVPGREPDRALITLNYAMFKHERGQAARAAALVDEAEAMLAAVEGPPLKVRAALAIDRGIIARQRSDVDEAIADFIEAIRLYREFNAEDPRIAAVRGDLVYSYLARGDLQAATAEVKTALREVRPDQAIDRAQLLSTRSAIRHAERRYPEAIADAEQALDLVADRIGPSHPMVGIARENLVFPLAASGRFEDAIAQADIAELMRDVDLDALFASEGEAARLKTMAQVRFDLDVYLTLALRVAGKRPEAVRRGLELLFRRQAVVAEGEALSLAPDPLDPELVASAARVRFIRSELARQRTSEAPDFARISSLVDERDRLELELAGSFPVNGFVNRMRTVTVDSVAGALGEGRILINFVLHRPIDFVPPSGAPSRMGDERYLAFILRPGTRPSVEIEDLGSASPIDLSVERWRKLIQVASPTASSARESVRDLILLPLEKHLGEASALVIVADGALARVPFAAIPASDGRLLLEQYTLSYVDSGRDVVRWSTPAQGQSSPPFVAGAIDYDAEPQSGDPVEAARPRLSFKIGHFEPLDNTGSEAQAVAALYAATATTGTTPREGIVKALESPEVIHLATHGYFLGPDLAPGVPNPMLRAGVVLAGFNRALDGLPTAVGVEEGSVNGEELLAMKLTGTKLVVLSACETGLGDPLPTEGVFGLRRSFAIASTDALVMSLWQVPDTETEQLMVDFHKRIAKGEDAAAALRSAQAGVRTRRPHPYYWAAFVLVGQPGPVSLAAHREPAGSPSRDSQTRNAERNFSNVGQGASRRHQRVSPGKRTQGLHP